MPLIHPPSARVQAFLPRCTRAVQGCRQSTGFDNANPTPTPTLTLGIRDKLASPQPPKIAAGAAGDPQDRHAHARGLRLHNYMKLRCACGRLHRFRWPIVVSARLLILDTVSSHLRITFVGQGIVLTKALDHFLRRVSRGFWSPWRR